MQIDELKKSSSMIGVFLIFFVTFCTLPAVIFCFAFLPSILKYPLVENGKDTFAQVTSYYSNVTVNDEPMYKLEFRFVDDKGNERTDTTTSAYTYYEAQSIFIGGYLHIKYDDKRAVQADFELGFELMGIGILGIFFVIGSGFGIAILFTCGNHIVVKLLRKKGKPDIGTFVLMSRKQSSMGLYCVTYRFTNDKGETKHRTTGSIVEYRTAVALKRNKVFDIVRYKNFTRIVHTPPVPVRKKPEKRAKIERDNYDDKMFILMCREINKEPTKPARLALLDSHKDVLDEPTRKKLIEYIDTFSEEDDDAFPFDDIL